MSEMPPLALAELADEASAIVVRVGKWICNRRPARVERKAGMASDASSVVTEIDREAERRITEALAALGGEHGLLTEEQADSGSRMRCEFFWCVDPLDGTLPFVEGREGYAVSVALVSRDGVSQLGAVYEPSRDALYCAARGHGIRACAAGAPSDGGLALYVDRSMEKHSAYEGFVRGMEELAVERQLALELQVGAGAVVNASRVLTRSHAAYVKFPKPGPGGGSLWDFAATACLFAESGRPATDIRGRALELNRKGSTFLGHRGALFASDQELANDIRRLATRLGADACFG